MSWCDGIIKSMQRTTVGVVRGGPSSEYDISLLSGAEVLRELDRSRYEPKDIFISKDGAWHMQGVEVPPDKALRGIDVVFNALHGEYGEDGTVQRLFDMHGVPYTGSGSVPSAIAFNKHHAKEVAKKLGFKVAQGVLIEADSIERAEEEALRAFRAMCGPWIIKPVASGSSMGVVVAKDFKSLIEGIVEASAISPRILVEEYISGREATCGVIDGYRGEEVYGLFPIEIVRPKNTTHWTRTAKYDGSSQEICPGNFSAKEKQDITEFSKAIHKELGLSHYSRSDFILSPRGIYFLEVNTLPGLTSESLLPKAIKAGGSTLSAFFTHVIELARGKK